MNSKQLLTNVASISNLLFEKEEAHVTRSEYGMITRNAELGNSSDGFRYLGRIYTQLTGAARNRGQFDPLHTKLEADMNSLQIHREVIKADRDWIKQALMMVLRECHSYQDMRDALPNGLKEIVPELAGLSRTRKEAYTLLDNPRSYNYYIRLRDKMEYYIATRLLY